MPETDDENTEETALYRTDFYSADDDGVYSFREAFYDAALPGWRVYDIDEALISKEGNVRYAENSRFALGQAFSFRAALAVMSEFERLREGGKAAVLPAEDKRFGDQCSWRHYSHMARQP